MLFIGKKVPIRPKNETHCQYDRRTSQGEAYNNNLLSFYRQRSGLTVFNETRLCKQKMYNLD